MFYIVNFCLILLATPFIVLASEELPYEIIEIMNQPKYRHAIWGLFAKDLVTGKVLFKKNENLLFSPASTTKLFSTAALLNSYGKDYRFVTPLYGTAPIINGRLNGNLILVGQGDLTFGGRQTDADHISFTKLDHINANEIPGVILTPEDPLLAFQSLAKQLYQKGLRELIGEVIIDDTLFETTVKRGITLSPILVNENLIDFVVKPTKVEEPASVTWRPQVPGIAIENKIITSKENSSLAITLTFVENKIVLEGTLPINQKEVIKTASIQNPSAFAKAALLQALEKEGIKVTFTKNVSAEKKVKFAEWISPPLSEYVKLILKVSHNGGADLIPLLLAAKAGKTSFDEGMKEIGKFLQEDVKLSSDSFVLIDAAGGNENRLTLQAEVDLLTYMHEKNPKEFKSFMLALPVLGVDGSLEDFAKKSPGAGNVFAKPGTGISFNVATGHFFLITQALAGYIEGKNGHLFAYIVVVNNGNIEKIEDVFQVFEDEGMISSLIYTQTK